jgi:hypothetical protein
MSTTAALSFDYNFLLASSPQVCCQAVSLPELIWLMQSAKEHARPDLHHLPLSHFFSPVINMLHFWRPQKFQSWTRDAVTWTWASILRKPKLGEICMFAHNHIPSKFWEEDLISDLPDTNNLYLFNLPPSFKTVKWGATFICSLLRA